VREVVARGERWEVSRTVPNPPWPCKECLARERIWRWLAENGHRSISAAKLAKGVEVGSFVRIYSHLERLVEQYPRGVPREEITLTFDPSSEPH
jgi:hypothetical protein